MAEVLMRNVVVIPADHGRIRQAYQIDGAVCPVLDADDDPSSAVMIRHGKGGPA
jgi:hypothetical protein